MRLREMQHVDGAAVAIHRSVEQWRLLMAVASAATRVARGRSRVVGLTRALHGTLSLQKKLEVVPSRALQELLRLRELTRRASATNEYAAKRSILAEYADLAPLLELYVE